ncbi:MAG: 3'(2'),5'-bisphosphate nucleotidase CysQ [Myxococcales bacterium]|nr:3'(2'),5'-bisphosphate nucleotidase CysQ [Myxococcales bacterium]
MSASRLSHELAMAQAAALAAGAAIEAVGPTQQVNKSDGSPVTAADLAANQALIETLRGHFPHDGWLSEESVDGPERLGCERVWVVDPLDGTRDFVARTGEFSVHVALVIDGQAQVAAVLEPSAGRLSWAVAGEGAFMSERRGPTRRLRVSEQNRLAAFRIGTSRFAANAALHSFLADSPPLARTGMGASTKMMALARGELDACVWLSSAEKEWDTCAPALIVTEAGGCVTDADGRAFTYNRPDVRHGRGILASNGLCHGLLRQRAQRAFPGTSA